MSTFTVSTEKVHCHRIQCALLFILFMSILFFSFTSNMFAPVAKVFFLHCNKALNMKEK